MRKASNQDFERHYFEMFRKDYLLPQGTITYGDRPDVILHSDKKIGVEITNFYHEKGHLAESEQAQRKLREKVISESQRIYQMENGKKIELTFGFEKANPIQDKKKLVKKILELVRHIDEWKTGKIRKEIFKHIPELSFVYLNAEEYDDAKWRVMQVNDVPIMSRDRLIDIVRDKEKRSREYRKCDDYWLLVVVDFINPAQDQEIQIEGFEKIQSEIFEKIIIYKTLFGHVVEAK
ncbi:MAG: hypothetical protein HUU08_08430 [Candidatus Brocadia sp.]|nr:hypothetical protein [Candidatus Brocadia sp.]